MRTPPDVATPLRRADVAILLAENTVRRWQLDRTLEHAEGVLCELVERGAMTMTEMFEAICLLAGEALRLDTVVLVEQHDGVRRMRSWRAHSVRQAAVTAAEARAWSTFAHLVPWMFEGRDADGTPHPVPTSERFIVFPVRAPDETLVGLLQVESGNPFDADELSFVARLTRQLGKLAIASTGTPHEPSVPTI